MKLALSVAGLVENLGRCRDTSGGWCCASRKPKTAKASFPEEVFAVGGGGLIVAGALEIRGGGRAQARE